jgi:hypothetical protein
VGAQGQRDVERPAHLQPVEARLDDADDLDPAPLDVHGAADDVRPCPQPAAPEAVAHDRRADAAIVAVVRCRQQAATLSADAEQREEVAAHVEGAQARSAGLRLTKPGVRPGGHVHQVVGLEAQLGEHRRRQRRQRRGPAANPAAPVGEVEHDQLLRVGDRQWPKQQGIEQLVDGGVGAGAERQRQDGDDGEPGAATQHPERMVQVAQQPCGAWESALLPERFHRPQLVATDASPGECLVRFQLRAQVGVGPAAANGAAQTCQGFAQPLEAHDGSRSTARMIVAIRSQSAFSATRRRRPAAVSV